MDIDEKVIISTAELVSPNVYTFLEQREGHAPAPALLESLQSRQHLSEPLARAVLWLLLEQGELKLGKSLELESGFLYASASSGDVEACQERQRRKADNSMDLVSGCYYRRKADKAVVKVLYKEAWPYECSCGSLGTECSPDPVVVYRLNDDEWPHRLEFIEANRFEDEFEDGLIWDPVKEEFE